MNDELSGQLARKGWRIPQYAQSALWLETDTEAVQIEGTAGLFELTVPAQEVRVRWGGAEGPVLAALKWQPDSLEWDGMVRLGGVVDVLHLQNFEALEIAVGLIYFGGHPLTAQTNPLSAPQQSAPQGAPDFFTPLRDDLPETVSTWLVPDDSPLLTMAQDAMMSKLRVWFTGQLADDQSGWHKLFGLPLLLEGVTLFAP